MGTSTALSAITLILVYTILATVATASFHVYISVYLYATGDADVYQDINISNAPALVVVHAIGQPYIAEAVYSDGTPAPTSINGTDIVIEAYTNGTISLHYLTALAEKQGKIWVINATTTQTLALTLPSGAAPVYMGTEPTYLEMHDDTVTLYFPPGNVYIEYLQAPTGQPGTGPGGSTGGSPGGGGEGGDNNLLLALLAILVAAAIVAGFYFYKRRSARAGLAPMLALDERDKQIISYIKEKGTATASEIMNALDIPKTPLYRRLNKLVKHGYLEEVPGPAKRYKLRQD